FRGRDRPPGAAAGVQQLFHERQRLQPGPVPVVLGPRLPRGGRAVRAPDRTGPAGRYRPPAPDGSSLSFGPLPGPSLTALHSVRCLPAAEPAAQVPASNRAILVGMVDTPS